MLMLIAALFSMGIFAQNGNVTEIKTTELPKETAKWVSENIPGGKIVRAGKIDDKGTISYAAVVESSGQKHSYLFDKNGKFTGKGDNLMKGKTQSAPATKAPASTQTTTTKSGTKQQTTTTTATETVPKK